MKAVIDRRNLILILGILVAVIILITVWSSQKDPSALYRSQVTSSLKQSMMNGVYDIVRSGLVSTARSELK